MGTKTNPSDFDCYANAEPDEPMFILLARDPIASFLVRVWVFARQLMGKTNIKQLDEAMQCANEMDKWRATHRS